MDRRRRASTRPPGRFRIAAGLLAVGLLVPLGACSGSGDAAAPSDARVLVALALETDVAGLATDARAAAPDGSSGAGPFLSLGEVASRHGAAGATISAAVAALGDLGIEVHADPTGAVLWGEVDVATAVHAFGVGFDVVDRSGTEVVRPTGTPEVPEGVDGVRAVVGLTGTLSTDDGRGSTTTTSTSVPTVACPESPMSASALASGFGLDSLTDAATGAGTTVALFEITTFDPAVLDVYDQCGATQIGGSQVTVNPTPLAPDRAAGDEVALDVVVQSLLVPDADLAVTQLDPHASVIFPLLQLLTDAEGAGATPEVLALTVGFCEQDLTQDEVETAEWLLATLAATGTTTVAATGDLGSSACHPASEAAAVQYPASSAWVVAAGGASFAGSPAAPSGLEVWNEGKSTERAAGGGTSALVDRPSWQTGAAGRDGKRTVPDFVALADAAALGATPVCAEGTCGWDDVGGTSLSAAALGAAAALSAEAQGSGGVPVRFGLLGPAIDRAGSDGSRVFVDVTTGDDELFTETCCAAGPGYDRASGWGLADLGALPPLQG